jgi:transcriptional regulator with XRE-family HTH domain
MLQSMHHVLPCYLHSLRKQWGLSQPELAELLGIGVSALSRFEGLSRRPTVDLVVGAEVIFGYCAKDVFPGLYREIERKIVNRAKIMHKRLEAQNDPSLRDKLRLLDEIIDRASEATLDV